MIDTPHNVMTPTRKAFIKSREAAAVKRLSRDPTYALSQARWAFTKWREATAANKASKAALSESAVAEVSFENWLGDITMLDTNNLDKSSARSMYAQCRADIYASNDVDELRAAGKLVRELVQGQTFSKPELQKLRQEYTVKLAKLKSLLVQKPGMLSGSSECDDANASVSTSQVTLVEENDALKTQLTETKEDIIKTKAIVARQSWSLEKLKLYCKNRDKFILALLQSKARKQSPASI